MGPRQLAREIKNESDLDADLSRIQEQVRKMRDMGASDEQIRENLPKVLKAKKAHEEVLDQATEDKESDEEQWIKVDHLPSKYKRDDWS